VPEEANSDPAIYDKSFVETAVKEMASKSVKSKERRLTEEQNKPCRGRLKPNDMLKN
jgi:hypothetical protein